MGGLERLTLRNFRSFEDVAIDFDPRVTVFIGENGAGKTSIAEAIASLVHGDDEGLADFPLRKGATEGRIAVRVDGVEAAAFASDGPRTRLSPDADVFAYGRYRRVRFPEQGEVFLGGVPIVAPELQAPGEDLLRSAGADARGRRTTSLTKPDNHLLRDLGQTVKLLHPSYASFGYGSDATWSRLNESLRVLDPGIEGIELVERDDRSVPIVRREGIGLELRELSDGYQAILVVVLDLMIRLRTIFPNRKDPLAAPFTLLVDEVDLHLHPRWQRGVVRQLATIFPKAQLIVTTHSPGVVQGAIDDAMRVVRLELDAGKTRATPLDEATRARLARASIGSIFVDKSLFGVRSRYSPEVEKTERAARKLARVVESGDATPEDRAKLLRKLDKLQVLQVREEQRRAEGPLLTSITRAQLGVLKTLNDKLVEDEAKS